MVYKSGLPVYRRMRDSVLIKKKNKKICNVECRCVMLIRLILNLGGADLH